MEFDKLTLENQRLAAEYEKLISNDSPLVTLENENLVLNAEKEKFSAYAQHLVSKEDKLIELLAEMNEQILEQGLISWILIYR